MALQNENTFQKSGTCRKNLEVRQDYNLSFIIIIIYYYYSLGYLVRWKQVSWLWKLHPLFVIFFDGESKQWIKSVFVSSDVPFPPVGEELSEPHLMGNSSRNPEVINVQTDEPSHGMKTKGRHWLRWKRSRLYALCNVFNSLLNIGQASLSQEGTHFFLSSVNEQIRGGIAQ